MADSQFQISFACLDRNRQLQGQAFGIYIDPSQTIHALKEALRAKLPSLKTVALDQVYILKLKRPLPTKRRSERVKAEDLAKLETALEESGHRAAPEETGPSSLYELMESIKVEGLGPDPIENDYVTVLDVFDIVGDWFDKDITNKVQAIVLHPILPEQPGAGE